MRNQIRVKSINNLFSALLVAMLIFTVYSCSDDTNNTVVVTGPAANTISGTITFADTNIITSGGYYDLSMYPKSSWPPAGPPSQNDSLEVTRVGSKYEAKYKFSNVTNGEYVLTTAWIKLPYNPSGSTWGLGMYGCDTSHSSSCIFGPSGPGSVTIANNAGVENVDILSWADTTKSIYHF